MPDTEPAASEVQVAGRALAVSTVEGFLADDARRADSFVTSFGTWHLPPSLRGALGSGRGHLEWVHETGELVLLAAVPHLGTAAAEVPATEGVPDVVNAELPLGVGTSGEIEPSGSPGMVRELFTARVVPLHTPVVVLTQVRSGWAVHRLLRGWHRHHRDEDGWAWLTGRLAAGPPST